MTITLDWWAIPLAITVVSILSALFWPCDTRRGDFDNFLRLGVSLVLALFVSLLAWAIAGFFK